MNDGDEIIDAERNVIRRNGNVIEFGPVADADWRPAADYTRADSYVVALLAADVGQFCVDVARCNADGWYNLDGWSYGQQPNARWKPIPAGYASWHYRDVIYPRRRIEPPPEPVYSTPGGVDVRLTAKPREILLAMLGGAPLIEKRWRWSSWSIDLAGRGERQTMLRAPIESLRSAMFIERAEPLPQRPLTGFREFEWRPTSHGEAWMMANSARPRRK
ncbi:hypothetical protein HNR60_001606 [Rhodopseudomonas rhenobacensis]|uniref:Uncharacterized protein n=1 Tax=Rhodopseudomonas rhenobacensis TaxID=87461 RepID=A0A7W7Z392_9BRAD|nr:hypothetical protein [Rhodopseudomonas rhenobacensis]MBB5046857.1 hypothetical protein [Rhodopseudomonas rhenobacensis]